MLKRLRKVRQVLSHCAWGLGTIAFFLTLKASGILQGVELRQLDFLLRLRSEEELDERIIIIELDKDYFELLREKHDDLSYFEYRDLALLTDKILQYQPAVVALDVLETQLSGSGIEKLIQLFQENKFLIGVEKAFYPEIQSTPGIPEKQLTFNDFPGDIDGQFRRIMLASYVNGFYRSSLAFWAAQVYLEEVHQISSENSDKNPEIPKFGNLEIPKFNPNHEPYRTDEKVGEGIQILMNFRQQSEPFRSISARDIIEDKIDASQLKDNIVLVGITDPAIAPYLNTSVPRKRLGQQQVYNDQIFGIELQAHAASQIISAVLDGRGFITGLNQGSSYSLIIVFGLLGCWIGRSSDSVVLGVIRLFSAFTFSLLIFLLVFFYQDLYIFPRFSMGALLVAGVGYLTIVQREIARKEIAERKEAERGAKEAEQEAQEAERKTQEKEALLQARLRAIENTFGEIHNGPLQILSFVLREIQDGETSIPQIEIRLRELNQRIRDIGEHLKQEAKTGESQILLRPDQQIELEQPLHELFYEIYFQSLQADWPNLKRLRIKSRSFEPVQGPPLGKDDKADICRFLEEAIWNVGKHADGATKLMVSGKQCQKKYILSIEDDGDGLGTILPGSGTRIARSLEERLDGRFERVNLSTGGVCCRFTWQSQPDSLLPSSE